ncbi:CBS domain-containing protein [Dyella soli]|uniref:CBS domain-containing protein n=1 Tax=Dyella soli TaxID=522319 RepID=A0A4R0YN89_9GAMM|nr:CBS domain-containing protein [Dyella soli]TCI10387.1 CBS domain-containing protein [Dyella soli]
MSPDPYSRAALPLSSSLDPPLAAASMPRHFRPLGRRLPLVVREDHSLREAADHMVEADVGRLVVMGGAGLGEVVGIITRGDLLAAHA